MLGCEATGFSVAGDRLTLRTAQGDVAAGDLLVGADGAGSVLRRVLHPSEPPPRSGVPVGATPRASIADGAPSGQSDLS